MQEEEVKHEQNDQEEIMKRTHRLFLDDIEYQAFVRRL
jgi:hypothetical protein